MDAAGIVKENIDRCFLVHSKSSAAGLHFVDSFGVQVFLKAGSVRFAFPTPFQSTAASRHFIKCAIMNSTRFYRTRVSLSSLEFSADASEILCKNGIYG